MMTSMRAAFRSIGLLAACGLASPALSAGGPACSVDTLSQTVDTNIALGAGFACQDLGTGAIFQTSYARSYDLSMGATAGLNVSITCVTFGIELNTIGDYLVDINIYQDLDGGLPDSSMGDLMLIASTMVSIPIVNDPFMDQRPSPFPSIRSWWWSWCCPRDSAWTTARRCPGSPRAANRRKASSRLWTALCRPTCRSPPSGSSSTT
jgi:hypothetical protein